MNAWSSADGAPVSSAAGHGPRMDPGPADRTEHRRHAERSAGFLGPRGTFSEQAARVYVDAASGRDVPAGRGAASLSELVPHRDIPELLHAVHRGDVDLGVVPAENSIEGTVVVTLDMLVHEVDVSIVGEIVIPVRHHLLARNEGDRGADALIRSIRTVVSHPQALAQCRRYLHTHLPDAVLQPALSTAAAAQQAAYAAEEHAGTAAIGNELCAELYGLTVLAKDIQDVSDNATRFFVVAGQDGRRGSNLAMSPGPTGRDKTTVVFGFAADRPGNLHDALGEFANRGINLSKLESRPAKHALGHYLFFADLEGHRFDAIVADALDALTRRCAYVKILGSYARASYPALTRPRAFPPGGLRDNRSP